MYNHSSLVRLNALKAAVSRSGIEALSCCLLVNLTKLNLTRPPILDIEGQEVQHITSKTLVEKDIVRFQNIENNNEVVAVVATVVS